MSRVCQAWSDQAPHKMLLTKGVDEFPSSASGVSYTERLACSRNVNYKSKSELHRAIYTYVLIYNYICMLIYLLIFILIYLLIFILIDIYIHLYILLYAYIYLYKHLYKYLYKYLYIYLYILICILLYILIYIHLCIYLYVYLYIYLCESSIPGQVFRSCTVPLASVETLQARWFEDERERSLAVWT